MKAGFHTAKEVHNIKVIIAHPNQWPFYKILGLYSSKCCSHENQGRMFLNEEDKGTQLNAMCDARLDLFVIEDIMGQLAKT